MIAKLFLPPIILLLVQHVHCREREPPRYANITLQAKVATRVDQIQPVDERSIPPERLRELCGRHTADFATTQSPLQRDFDMDMAADDPFASGIPDLPMRRTEMRLPAGIDARIIDSVAAQFLPEIQRQLREENQRTSELLQKMDRKTAADAPTARGFPLQQGMHGAINQTLPVGDDGPNSPATLKALYTFSKPTRLSVDLGEKARIFEKITANLIDQFKLDKDQVVQLTGINLEGTQLENFTPAQPPTLDITVEVGGRMVNIQALGNQDPEFIFSKQSPHLRSRSLQPAQADFRNHYGVPLRRSKRQVQQCADRAFRDASGRCNNLNNPTWGQSFQPYVRFVPPDYADGVSVPRFRSARTRNPLPSPRQITVAMHQAQNRPHDHITHILMQWGQFLDHDITHTPITAIEVNQNGRSQLLTPKCCDLPAGTVAHSSCFAIPIPRNDPFYTRFRQECLEFVRSSPATTVLGPREQLNQLTSYIDASNVYGSTQATANSLRSFSMGMLLTQQARGSLDQLLPSDPTTEECFRRTNDRTCFRAGDVRVNVHTGLAAMHTLWIREHNRIARSLFSMNQASGWDDERVYQETRRILGAMFQVITYNEFLPVVLGRDVMNQFGLNLQTTGYYTGYSDQVNPSIANEFATAAYRFGHTLANGEFRLDNQNGQAVLANNLVNSFFQPLILYDPGRCDQYLRGMTSQKAQTFDRNIAEELTNHLFQPPGQGFGNDLISRNIQRGRDHGLPGYNAIRKFCGFQAANSFDELRGVMPDDALQRLGTLYEHPDDVDLFTAGISEFPVSGGLIGPTFACIIARQFHNLRRGDRYWHENNLSIGSFSPAQLAEIRKTTLAKVLCDNTDSLAMQRRVMVEPIPFMNINPKLPCNQIPGIDLSVWRVGGSLPVFQQDFVPMQPPPPIQPFIASPPQPQPPPQQPFFFPQPAQQNVAPQFPQPAPVANPVLQMPILNQFNVRSDPAVNPILRMGDVRSNISLTDQVLLQKRSVP